MRHIGRPKPSPRILNLPTDEFDFEPRLGRTRKKGGRGRKYLALVVIAARRAGGRTGVRNRRFDGSRIGRGAGIGRLLSGRDRHAGLRARRVVVKARLVRLAGKALTGAGAHLRYIQRDGVTREGEPGRLYSRAEDVADGKAFLERCGEDRHQFRFIVSAEDADQYSDLKPFVRRLMTQMEADLGTKLDWVAVDHFNTGHPHSHIMLRGRDDRGENLVIAREYIAHGLRERAAQLVTLDLGPRTDLEIEQRLRRDVGAERLTAVDRQLLRDADERRTVAAGDRDAFRQSLRAGRLQKLGRLGLAEELGGGRWRLAEGMETALRDMGERGDIIRTMQRALGARKLDRPLADRVIHEPGAMRPLVGRVVMRGLSDELRDRHYLIVDGIDGRCHYVAIGKGEAVEPLAEGAIVRIASRGGGVRQADRTIAEVAAANGGRYDVDAHLRHDPGASQAFAETHVRRLEAMRRLTRAAERAPDGSWIIASDHLERAEAFEARQLRDRPVIVETLSPVPLERLPRAEAATWLDRELVADAAEPVRDCGFGREVRAAQALRRQWLMAEGLAESHSGATVYRAGMVEALRRRELLRVAGQLSDELGLPFVEAKPGERIDGTLRRAVEMTSGRHALIERSREFTLVPWRPVLERHVGKSVSGILRGDGINWTLGRGRGGPSIS
ncbi:MAG: relaxase/mobilization nuclease RlxS [Sphingosinicella sp.]|uniref:relaxase/mobilization nuclease RlxS n=1 Tax=Sphingosinicella sp. TaxID=1917971 RepID=UPI004037D153